MLSGNQKGPLYSLVKPKIKGQSTYCFGHNIDHDTLKKALDGPDRERRVKINPRHEQMPKDLVGESFNCDKAVLEAKHEAMRQLNQAKLNAEIEIRRCKKTILDLKLNAEKSMKTMPAPPLDSVTKQILKPLHIGGPLEESTAKKAASALAQTATDAAANVDDALKNAKEKLSSAQDGIVNVANKGREMVNNSIAKAQGAIGNIQQKTQDFSKGAVELAGKLMGTNKTATGATGTTEATEATGLMHEAKKFFGLVGGRTRRSKRKKRKKTRKKRKRKTHKRRKSKKRKTRKR